MLTVTRITLADGSTVDVKPNIADMLAFETTLRKNKAWGSLAENTLRMFTFRAWHCGHRTGAIALSWDEFTSGDTAVIDVSNHDLDADDSADDAADEVAGVGFDTATGAPTS